MSLTTGQKIALALGGLAGAIGIGVAATSGGGAKPAAPPRGVNGLGGSRQQGGAGPLRGKLTGKPCGCGR